MSAISVIYVDDEPDLLEIARIFLEQGGDIRVDTCTSPEEARARLGREQYDAIISDYQMPEMDGIAFLKLVRSEHGRIPFILFTGKGREEVVIQAINNGADFYLQKGGDPKAQFAELAHKVRLAVRQRQAEASIHDHERRESDIINFLPDATFAIDTRGVVIAWNRAMERMTGVPAADILGKGEYGYALPFYRQRRPILIDLVLSGDPETARLYPFIRREGPTLFSEITIPHFNDGKGATLWFTATPLFDTAGTIVGAIESIRDISEQKQIETALRESEEKFREMADMLPQIVFEVDLHGAITYTNAVAFQMFGYSREEFRAGLPVSQMIAPADREKGMQALGALLAGSAPPSSGLEYRALRRDGSTFPMVIYTTPIEHDGRITGARGIIVDSSGRRKTEEDIHDRERVLSTLISNLPGFVYRCRNDRDWTMTFISGGCREVTGYAPEEFLENRTIAFNAVIHPDHRDRIWQKWQEVLGQNGVFEDEYPIVTKAGEIRQVWERGRGIFGDDGQLQFLEGFITDVTRQRKTELALAEKTAELEAKGKYYELLLHTSTDAIHVIDREGRLREWNDAFLAHLGYAAEDAAGLNVTDWNPEFTRAEMRERIAAFIRSGSTFETRHRRKDGTLMDVEVTATSVVIDGEELLYASARDITERKRAETALRESEARYRNIVESFEDLYYETDENGIIRFLSPSCERLTGWEARDLVGQPVSAVYADMQDRAPLIEAMRKYGYVRDYELVLKKRDGTLAPVSLSAHLIRNPDGSMAGIAGSLRDMTERKRALEEVRQSREQLALAIAGSGAGLWDWNVQEGTVALNEQWAGKLGYSIAELEPVTIKTWEQLCHPDDLKQNEGVFAKYFSGELPAYEVTTRMRHRDGHWIWMMVRGKAVERDAAGRPLRMIGTYLDISRLKRLEDALREANTKLNLLSGITRHDLTNQVTALRGFLAVSKRCLNNPEKMAEFIAREQKIAENIERQIAFTRSYQDMGVKEAAWQDVAALIRDAAADLPFQGTVLAADIRDIAVYADPLLEKVFYNLIDNALRYGGEKMTTIRFFSQEDPDGLRIVCEDDGAGIGPGEREHLFERGFGRNTGLGLFLVREILGITGITIREAGSPGSGARFEMLVPKGMYRVNGA